MTTSRLFEGGTLNQRFVVLLATGAGVGYFPIAPGTAGTILALPFSLALNRISAASLPAAMVVLAVFIGVAIPLCTSAAKALRAKDPPAIVIDEIAGFLVANFLNPNRLGSLTVAFICFRFFDITKPFPASRLEKLPGGAGVVLDDVMAGIYTFVVLRLLLSSELL